MAAPPRARVRLGLRALLLLSAASAAPRCPADSSTVAFHTWMRMWGPPGPTLEWQGPPPAPARDAMLGYTFDLEPVPPSLVRQRHPGLFAGLGALNSSLRSPCWEVSGSGSGSDTTLECLPHTLVLGAPKCATSDLWERLVRHPEVVSAIGKETRFFSPGELAASSPPEGWIGMRLPLALFTHHFAAAASRIQSDPAAAAAGVVLEGGPHTLWWSTQRPDEGRGLPGFDVAPPSLLFALQPKARLIVLVGEPTARAYSDFHFLASGGVVSTDAQAAARSRDGFHSAVAEQVQQFAECVGLHAPSPSPSPSAHHIFARSPHEYRGELLDAVRGFDGGHRNEDGPNRVLRAVQACACDRNHFGRPGSGRLAIGVYVAHLTRWYEAGWLREQVLVTRREDMAPSAHVNGTGDGGGRATAETVLADSLKAILKHMGVAIPAADSQEWRRMIELEPQNVWRRSRPPMRPDTAALLARFYGPFNAALALLEGDTKYEWGYGGGDGGGDDSGGDGAGLILGSRRAAVARRRPDTEFGILKPDSLLCDAFATDSGGGDTASGETDAGLDWRDVARAVHARSSHEPNSLRLGIVAYVDEDDGDVGGGGGSVEVASDGSQIDRLSSTVAYSSAPSTAHALALALNGGWAAVWHHPFQVEGDLPLDGPSNLLSVLGPQLHPSFLPHVLMAKWATSGKFDVVCWLPPGVVVSEQGQGEDWLHRIVVEHMNTAHSGTEADDDFVGLRGVELVFLREDIRTIDRNYDNDHVDGRNPDDAPDWGTVVIMKVCPWSMDLLTQVFAHHVATAGGVAATAWEDMWRRNTHDVQSHTRVVADQVQFRQHPDGHEAMHQQEPLTDMRGLGWRARVASCYQLIARACRKTPTGNKPGANG